MKKVLVVLGVLVGLLVLLLVVVLVVGWRQPVDHVAASRAELAKPPEEVWARIADFERWPDWNTTFDEVVREADRDGKPYWRFEGGLGSMPMVIEESTAPLRLVTRIPADADLGYSGTWTYELALGAAGGTTLTVTEAGHVESLLFRGIGALFMDPHDSMNGFLVDLGQSFGADVEPQEVR
jgi:uncharacterized protein YndB with AHSA1/START domain